MFAATLGFGLGQAAQGRWRRAGWIFALGESGVLLAELKKLRDKLKKQKKPPELQGARSSSPPSTAMARWRAWSCASSEEPAIFRAMSAPEPAESIDERLLDMEVRIAYQDRLVRELDALVRQFADRLDAAERELKALKQGVVSPNEGVGPANERPPHY